MVERRDRDARAGRGGRGGLAPSAGASRNQGVRLAAALREAGERHPRDEADFRADAERALEDIAAELRVTLDTQRELTLANAGSTRRRYWPVYEPCTLATSSGAGGDEEASLLPLSAEVDDPVGPFDDVQVVLDDEHRVAGIRQPLEDVQELVEASNPSEFSYGAPLTTPPVLVCGGSHLLHRARLREGTIDGLR